MAAVRSSAHVVPRVVTASPSEVTLPTSADQRFRSAHRLHKTDEYSSVFAFRRALRGRFYMVHYRPNGLDTARLGVVVAKKLAKRANVPMDRVFVNVQRYGNMSAATVPVALCEALEQGRIKPGSLLLMPAFGGGLTFCAHLVRWGTRTQPIGSSSIELPPSPHSALELVQAYRRAKGHALT